MIYREDPERQYVDDKTERITKWDVEQQLEVHGVDAKNQGQPVAR